ncbi:bile acid:sodium symporter family protein [Halarchaeum nitratireducens]|uniref:Sodium transporter n=1 Tax=Halarchaeum nitratireducens TaxID=489913 RepID=A0A830GEY0_9EURY|nr:bile acid:sodium symporter family protein [Halarchaeum nitratireducens]MBP2252864.1 BASS family bile acid:Na+ symporter [Halarchaeum solikamskense]GGN26617.1 sodium transporter [Halarchaeum nitratireducens]
MSALDYLETVASYANKFFVVWVVLLAAIALYAPAYFTPIGAYITPLLGLIMLGMGLTLLPEDFRRIVERPRDVGIGALTQWLVMPVAAYALTLVLGLPPELALGVILVGAAPGGTASNVMTYLGNGDVALSVSITTVTTLTAPILMPAWVLALAGESIDVTFMSLFSSIVQIVFIPVLAGFALRYLLDRYAPRVAEIGLTVFPTISVAAIVAIVAAVVAGNKGVILGAAAAAIAVVVLHNGIGLTAGNLVGRATGMSEDRVRATTFEVGLQNSGLAVALASAHFGGGLVALAPALFSVWHNVSGPALASYFSSQDGTAAAGDRTPPERAD